MCGIAGILGGRPDELAAIGGMTDALAHRGPDDRGVFVDEAVGLALGHRRLSIVDLSPEGHQPMRSGAGRYEIVFNGEIYNYRELGAELRDLGHPFRGHSDTEVILAACDAWGLDGTVRRLAGIFAFALWDRAERALHLVRDHLGVKPLYYAWAGGTLLFGSELGALAGHPRFDRTIDRHAVALLLRSNCIPAPHTIYAGARKLPPGTVLTVRAGEAADGARPAAYWTAGAVAAAGLRSPLAFGSDAEAVDALDRLLRGVVASQMVADVPLGAFLSGGIDSSTVVALMQTQSAAPVRTFSIGFGRADYDESSHAARVAAHLGTAHTALHVTDADARAVVPLLPRLWDEPFADSSQIPTYLVSQLARGSVTVALSGDGGDELFAGYNRHVWAERLWRRLRLVPRPVRHAAGHAIAALPPEAWDRGARASGVLRGTAVGEAQFGRKLHKLAGVLGARSADALYTDLASHWTRPEDVVLGAGAPPPPSPAGLDGARFTERMMLRDLVTYLPDDILVKVDRASMATGLEARVPLLDHRVVEFAWRLPLGLKLRDGVGKWVLRAVLDRYVPRPLVDRPKAGFAVPLADWLRGPLRAWADDLLAPDLLRRDGYLAPAPVRARWDEHLRGTRDWSPHLWDVLMFQAWLHDGPG